MATTTRKQRSTDTRTTPHSLASKASVKFGFVVRPRRSRADPTSTKTHRSHATTPNEATTRADEPSWHQLLGTLLSSQRTDAHPSLTLAGSATGGCHSNLPEFLARFVAVPGDSLASNPTRDFRPSFRAVLSRSDIRNPTRLSDRLCPRCLRSLPNFEPGPRTTDRAPEAPEVLLRGWPPVGATTEVNLGGRHFLPCGLENITRTFRPASSRRAHGPRTLPAPHLTCGSARAGRGVPCCCVPAAGATPVT
jgi:hypothetical protein